VIALVVGQAFSGGFLTHGYQANCILAFDDPGVTIHAMHKEAAARITRRSVKDLEQLGHEIVPMSYDIKDYAKLGILHELLHVDNPFKPTQSDIDTVRQAIAKAIDEARGGTLGLSARLRSDAAKETRKAGIAARALMERQWLEA
jgi:malonate decarboxylase gamma subunit